MKIRARLPSGFTLIELLVVIGIIAVLAALLLAVTGTVKAKSNQAVALSNMRQVGTAVALYAADHSYSLPGRVRDPDEMRWPTALATYLHDNRVYAAPGLPNYLTENKDPLSNSQNNTSFIMNGFNDRGAYDNEALHVRLNQFDRLSEVILFGMQIDTANFYMDFMEKNQDGVLKLDAYNNGSVYLFADGSARFLTKAEYEAPLAGTNERYGDWLWLADKSGAIPQ